jgi:hypothetical protein
MAKIANAQKYNKDLADELIKCKIDPIFFIQKYVKIQSPNKGGTIPFHLHPYQKDILKNLKNKDATIIVKSRQLGVTTVGAAFCLWYCLFHDSQLVGAIATNLITAKNFVLKVQFAYDLLPDFFKQLYPIKENNATTISWQNGSKVMATGSGISSLRGQAISYLIVDEAAFIEGFNGPEGIWASVAPVISTGGKIMMLSSPNGTNGVFYELFTAAKNGNNSWVWMELPWDVDPTRDAAWLENMRGLIGNEEIIKQEYFCSFAVSGEAVLSAELREYLGSIKRAGYTNPMIPHAKYIEFDRVIGDESYVIGADVSGGKSDDYSTIQVMSAGTGMQVAEFQAKILPEDFARLLIRVGHYWNNAAICIENNSVAQVTIVKIKEYGYPNMYAEDRRGMPTLINVYQGYDNDDYTIGFNTQDQSRKRLITEMIQQLEKRRYTPFSERLLTEFNTFIWKNSKLQAAKGANDDLIMALAFAIWCRETAMGYAKSKLEMTKALANSISVNVNRVENMPHSRFITEPHKNHVGVYSNKNSINRFNESRLSLVDEFSRDLLGSGSGGNPQQKKPMKSYWIPK